ncbi:S-methyl-5'-thioinosine phosphorylase [Nostocoides sp. Soil756]|jgi:5'-methylthioadenosine phosphorylase|uniref:S-methyl-5'-thioinosine phosphorylase n=1 Tax=Nostocoides sp. Soil756 TaxID=1736399 RepID=UPI0006F95318|nr:S-methyl-5'-thioinosine phosphorylase [Tetrasphaera sp. Soil756]KRE63649.1 S-methyl-5'-thioadenosine phosphorylase [Tetrasphaera sp. Soil756]
MTLPPLAVVAGTGFYDLDALEGPTEETVETAWGTARVVRGHWHGLPVVFLTRHGAGHSVPPHLVNYRANIRALADLGVQDVVAVNVTGSIDPDLAPGDLVCLDDFLDLTRQRPLTFVDGSGPEGVVHTDVSAPYDAGLRREILEAAAAVGQPMRDGGVYAAFEGPRFETAAEIRLARLAGGTVAGMTGVPEVTLALEAGLRYAAVSLVVNPATGVGPSDEPITMAEIEVVLARSRAAVLAVLDELVHTRATFATDDAAQPEEPA